MDEYQNCLGASGVYAVGDVCGKVLKIISDHAIATTLKANPNN